MKRIKILILAFIIACAPKPNTKQIQSHSQSLERFSLPFSIDRLPLELRQVFPVLSVVAVGDIMLGNHTEEFIRKFGPEYPFAGTDSILRSGDITLGNLEAAFAENGTPFDKRFTFKVPPEFAASLPEAGFNVLNLANNHILDYGEEALHRTIEVLDSLSLSYCGAGNDKKSACEPTILEKNGFKIAVFGYSMTFPSEFWATDSSGGTCFPYESMLKRTIPHYDSTCDIVIANFHWGRELKNQPRDYQQKMARRVIDLGADLVIGHHPHVLQGMEIYKNRLIAYSLGNFCFSSYSRRATESVILKVALDKNGLVFARVIPINVNNYEIKFQPQVFDQQKSREVIQRLNEYSRALESPAFFDSTGFLINEYPDAGDVLFASDSTDSAKGILEK